MPHTDSAQTGRKIASDFAQTSLKSNAWRWHELPLCRSNSDTTCYLVPLLNVGLELVRRTNCSFFQMAMEGDQIVEEIIPAEDDEVNMSLTDHTSIMKDRVVHGGVTCIAVN